LPSLAARLRRAAARDLAQAERPSAAPCLSAEEIAARIPGAKVVTETSVVRHSATSAPEEKMDDGFDDDELDDEDDDDLIDLDDDDVDGDGDDYDLGFGAEDEEFLEDDEDDDGGDDDDEDLDEADEDDAATSWLRDAGGDVDEEWN
jgi:hypothetical protein